MNTKNLNKNLTNINNLGFEDIWSGPTYKVYNESLDELVTSLTKAIEQIDQFEGTLERREKYVTICQDISSKVALRSKYDPEDPKQKGTYDYITYEINKLEGQRKQLRTLIIAELESYGVINAEVSPMRDLQTTEMNIMFDFEELFNRYNDPENVLTVSAEGLFSLYNQKDENGNIIPYSGEEYVNGRIADVVSQCRTEREIAVNLAYLIMELAADKGVKLKYENNGASGGHDWNLINYDDKTGIYTFKEDSGYNPNIIYNMNYNNITQMHEGMDCNAWVSYLINVAVAEDPTVPNPEGFHWARLQKLHELGDKISIVDAKPGDVYLWWNGEQVTHTGMIMGIVEDPNNPRKGEIWISESGGNNSYGKEVSWLGPGKYEYTINDDGSMTMGNHTVYIRNYDKVYSGEQTYH